MNDPVIEPIAIPIRKAAEIVGCSRPQFYKHWIGRGLVKPVDLGARGKSIILEQLRAAIAAEVARQQA
jgi:predicted DNA-binding transcriptional regulator AlpA